MSKKAFIGYDLGDGETITDFSVLSDNQIKESVQTVFVGMTMPDSNTPGQAIPTAYGFDQHTGKILFASSIISDPGAIRNICVNFKRRPSDLLDKDLLLSAPLLLKALQKKLPTENEWPLLYTEPMRAFIRSVVTFTDALFGDPVYQEFVRSSAVDCESIVFAVGHPTRWDDLDVALYKAILAKSILGKGSYAGKPTELVMAAESRAAVQTGSLRPVPGYPYTAQYALWDSIHPRRSQVQHRSSHRPGALPGVPFHRSLLPFR